ncbi:MAG TPA: hypothetical protein VKV26_00600 [Dehalococcoidia bacterium]|nr:hypothetical protein [Dehalococcoidia bacterium]
MDESQPWQAHYDELRAVLRRIGAILGDKRTPAPDRETAAQEFISAWQQITRHIKDQPATAGVAAPRD